MNEPTIQELQAKVQQLEAEIIDLKEQNQRLREQLQTKERTYTVEPKPDAAKVEKHKGIDSRFLQQNITGADPTNPLYDKVVVESGTYEQIGMSRDEVAAAIQRLGAKLNRDVSPRMNIFVTGNKPGPSKMQKVQQWRSEGIDIRIISQIELKEIIEHYLTE